jgi:hypothetical protein
MPDKKVLQVPLIGQQTDFWCWAACGEMLMKYLGHDVPQCQQVTHRYGAEWNVDCCTDPIPHECIRSALPDFGFYGFASQTTDNGVALSFDQLKAQIDAGKPVAFAWDFPGLGRHMMVAAGYAQSKQLLLINDPWGPLQSKPPHPGDQKWITYAIYVSEGAGSANGSDIEGMKHTHWLDIWDITWQGSAPGGAQRPAESVEQGAAGIRGGETYASPQDLAIEALELVPELTTAGYDVYDASQLSLGEPLPIHYIWHNDPRMLEAAGDDVDKLLTDGDELLYPVLRGNEVISSIVAIRQKGKWTLKSIGGPNWAKALTAARDKHAAATGTAHSEYVVIQLPHMYQTFLAHREDDRWMMTHVQDHEGYGFRCHETQPAHEVLKTILPDANAFRDTLE